MEIVIKYRRPLYEGVDWNPVSDVIAPVGFTVALFTRAWIEILKKSYHPKPSECRPLYEGVDWNCQSTACQVSSKSRPLYEGVDWNNIIQHEVFET